MKPTAIAAIGIGGDRDHGYDRDRGYDRDGGPGRDHGGRGSERL